MKIVSSLVVLAAADDRRAGDCDLSGVPGLFKEVNGKFTYDANYKLKRGRRNPANGETLVNPGKILKGRAFLRPTSLDQEFTDAWVTCKSNKWSSFPIRCYLDGSFTINGQSGDDIALPECEPVGCDPSEIPFTGTTNKCKHFWENGLERNGNKCERTCHTATGELFTTKQKIACVCDLASQSPTFGSCSYKITSAGESVPWDSTRPNGNQIVSTDECSDNPGTTEAPTTDPPTEPAVWGEWSAWNACSAECGEGVQSRSRQCSEEGQCEGDSVETQACTGPDGDCPQGCKLNIGDFEQELGKTCSPMFRAADGYYLPKSGRCPNLSCKSGGEADYKTLVCNCSKRGGCGIKIEGELLSEDFNSVTDCKANLGGRDGIGGNEKRYRWADGRRSAAQPESEVSGGDDFELMNVCYAPWAHVYPEMRTFLYAETETAFNTLIEELGLPFAYDGERHQTWVASVTYGTVVERDDGVLVCQHSNPKFPDWSEEHEHYLQLSVKRGAVNWMSSEKWIRWTAGRPAGAKILFMNNQMISQAGDTSDSRNLRLGWDAKWPDRGWPRHYNDDVEATHRYLCRVQDSRDEKWYIGATAEVHSRWGDPFGNDAPGWSDSSVWVEIPICVAVASDGNILKSHAHNFWVDKEENSNRLNTEYLVMADADDGSYWGEWSEWEDCSNFCGYNLKRTQTRPCYNSNGEEISQSEGINCYPEATVEGEHSSGWASLYFFRWSNVYTNEKKESCLPEQVLTRECPRWAAWSEYGECSVTCGAGEKARTRECVCGSRWYEDDQVRPCHEIDHPLGVAGLCGDDSVQTQECLLGPCGSDLNGLAEGNGIGLGCKSDTKAMNRASGEHNFICYDTTTEYEELVWTEYENEFGFVPHNYACWSSSATCGSRFRFDDQFITKENPTVCDCNDGVCTWSIERQDCSRGYEWIRMPINDLANHPFADKIVDFNDPSSTDPQTAFTAVNLYNTDSKTSYAFRQISAAVPIQNNQVVSNDDNAIGQGPNANYAWVLTQECESGSLEWVEGPFHCAPYETELDANSFKCQGDPRSHVMVDSRDYTRGWQEDAGRIIGICRFRENNEWVPGRLLQFKQYDPSKWGADKTLDTKPQCCPYTHFDNNFFARTQGCRIDRGWENRPYGTYDIRPYQFLYSGNCRSPGQAYWDNWSEWGECSKTCENGVISGTRSKTRSCVNGEVGDYGCHDNTPLELTEPCGMNLQCQSKGCYLDMNFVDFHRFRLAHVDGVKDSDFWQLNNVYTNRRFDLFAEPRDWSGFFPEGSMVASYRCFNPNTNILSGQEHDATCVCSGDSCDWDREMPSCTQHETDHAGYSWFMPPSATEGSYCVAANYGGVGIVQNGQCSISMATLPGTVKSQNYFKTTNAFVVTDDTPANVINEIFANTYPSFNTYYGGEAKQESDFYELSSTCGASAFKWVSVDEYSSETAVHLPTTFAWLHLEYNVRFQHERAHLCKVDYGYGKTCYGRYVNGKCGDVELSDNYSISILQLDQDNCSAQTGAWSDCVGESGTNCGPGTQSRDGVERACRGTCMEDHLKQYSDWESDDNGYVCNTPSYPLVCRDCMSQRSDHMEQSGSPVFAKYPMTATRYDEDELTWTCSGGGYWDVDYLTGERYYALAPGETCNFSCTQPMHKFYGAQSPSWYEYRTPKCHQRGYLYTMEYQFLPTESRDGRCVPDYCVLPSFGLWPINDNRQQGTRVSMGVECDGQIDHGSWVQAQEGARCKLVCTADNGKAYRADTYISDFECRSAVYPSQHESHGCTANCVSDFITRPVAEWGSNSNFNHQIQATPASGTIYRLADLAAHNKAAKCYKARVSNSG